MAQICALQFWHKSNENREKAWEDYLNLCKKGGSKSFLELVKEANLNNPFQKETIERTIEPVKVWLDSINDTNM